MNDVRAYRRVMDAVNLAGSQFELTVSIDLPRAIVEYGHPAFECSFTIALGNIHERHTTSGSDELDAIYFAFLSVGSILTELREEYVITWHGEPYTRFPNAGDPIAGL